MALMAMGMATAVVTVAEHTSAVTNRSVCMPAVMSRRREGMATTQVGWRDARMVPPDRGGRVRCAARSAPFGSNCPRPAWPFADAGASMPGMPGPHHSEGWDAVVLVSFGGPDGPDDVLPFLENVTRGRGVPPERLEEV